VVRAPLRSTQGYMTQSLQNEPKSAMILFKRAFESWPYIFVLISIAGFIYIAMTVGR
jgi:hypothetical protein